MFVHVPKGSAPPGAKNASEMSGPLFRALLALTIVASMLGAAPASGVGGPTLEALDDLLTQVAAPDLDDGLCGTVLKLPGGGEEGLPCGEEAKAQTGAADEDPPPFELRAREMLPTPQWYFAAEPLAGGPAGRYVRVHGRGDVAAMEADGTTAWNRSALSLYDDWKLEPSLAPFVMLGAAPLDPFVAASERPYAVGDATGDGLDDVIVAHWVFQEDALADGTPFWRSRGIVTVLDGQGGAARWHRAFPGRVTQLVFDGDLLTVGQETGDVRHVPTEGEDGSRSTLHALRFSIDEDDELVADTEWTVPIAPWARITAAEPAGPNLLAAAWTDKALGDAGVPGRVMLVDTREGAVRWQRDTTAYPRAIRLDAGRNRLVVQEHADPTGNVFHHAISTRGLVSGNEETRWEREDAVLLAVQVGNVTGSPDAEVVVSDVQVVPPEGQFMAGFGLASRASALDGGTGETIWDRVTHDVDLLENRPTAVPLVPLGWGLRIVPTDAGTRVLLGSWYGLADVRHELLGLHGDTGVPLWRNYEHHLGFSPLMMPFQAGGQPGVIMPTSKQIARVFSAVDGSVTMEHRLFGGIISFAFHDLNDDGIPDLVAGTQSGLLVAMDGRSIGDDPDLLWRAEAADGIHKLEVADVAGDGAPELVAAAGTDGIHVFDLATGARRYRVASPSFAWTFELSDLDGDGRPDIVAPGTALRAFRGTDGSALWSYPPVGPHTQWNGGIFFSQPAVTEDGLVVAQFHINPPDAFFPLARHVVGVDGATGLEAWRVDEPSTTARARLWRSVVAGDLPGAPNGVAVTYSPSGHGVRTDVHDAATGDLLHGGPDPGGNVHMLTELMPGSGLTEVNWTSVANTTPVGVTSTRFFESTDATMADFGDLGPAFVRAWHGTMVHPVDAATGARGPFPQAVAQWRGFFGGAVQAVDLDGDGMDEIVSTTFDWHGADQVARMEDSGFLHFDTYLHGLAILEAVPTG